MNEYNFQAMLSISFANLCHLFSSLRKGRLHYIRTVGGGVTIFFPPLLSQIRTERNNDQKSNKRFALFMV